MKIVYVNNPGTGLRVRSDLARLTASTSQKFLSHSMVRDYLEGKTKLDYKLAKTIMGADKSVLYIEKFVSNKIAIKSADHLVALLCIFSHDSLGSKVLSEEFYDYVGELQSKLDECAKYNYNGVHSAVIIMDYLGNSGFLEGKPIDVWYLLYNLFLHKEGVCLVLEDTDPPDSSLILDMKYRIQRYASKLSV